MITDTQARALGIIRKQAPITPAFFARLMWPDSPSWTMHSRVGRGSTTGVGVTRAAGAYLARLSYADYVDPIWRLDAAGRLRRRGYALTQHGHAELRDYMLIAMARV